MRRALVLRRLVIGILQATYPFMQFIGAPILGRLSDRFGRKPVLIASQIGTLAGFILLGFADSIFLLFVSRIIDGLSGANIATAQAAVADSTNEKTRTQGLGLDRRGIRCRFCDGTHYCFHRPCRHRDKIIALLRSPPRSSRLLSILLTTFWFKETYKEVENPEASRKRRPFSFGALKDALSRPPLAFCSLSCSSIKSHSAAMNNSFPYSPSPASAWMRATRQVCFRWPVF
jgi:hypothetical protein